MKKNNKIINKRKNRIEYGWIIKIILLTFVISMFFSFVSETAIPNVNLFFGIIITLLFILIGVLFDMVGLAVTAADEVQLHSMAAKKIRGAKLAIKFKKNADKVSSFCQDVIGDICGIVSGSTATVIAMKIMEEFNTENLLITLIVMGLVSAFTIGGKAIEKSLAINKSNEILYKFSYIVSFIVRGDK